MIDRIVYFLYSSLLVSGILTGWLSQLGMEYLFVIILLSMFMYSTYTYSFKKEDLLWLSFILFSLSFVIFMNIGSDSTIGAKEKFFQLIVTVLYFFCGVNCLNNRNLERFCNASTIYISIIVAIYAYVFVFVAGSDLSLFKVLSIQDGNRVISDYLLLATITYPIFFIKLFLGKKDIYFILILLSSLFCLSLGGRGPFVFLIVIISIAVIKDFKKHFNSIIASVFFIVILIFYSGIFDVFIARFNSISNGDISLQIRFKEYFLALESISNHVIFGSGVGMSGIILGYGDVYAYPHNIILESWLELGIIGAFIVFLAYIFFSTHWLLCSKFKLEFWVGLICLFYLINALKSGSIYEQRYLAFYMGIFVYFRVHKKTLKDK
ncbi:O-antigen ligase [Aliivibrio sp. 1S128]|uniref:O-antigen ligase family protein n=1 Tax=Aliivibrio sp. 1S128 TaxID=1840085 RepID=UPI00159EDE8A|nr:O-antigen ligase family protein [Aliivibrio sp. 1S128]